jgi:NTE family protein
LADPTPQTKTKPKPHPVCLALQGGGSHGAFQWGVLDRLLEEDLLDFRIVTAASAGAMNGAALVSGLAKGANEGAREALDFLWREVNRSGGRNVFGDSGVWSKMFSPDWMKETFAWRMGETFASTLSPYTTNPFNLNPLKRVVEASIDFEAVQNSDIELIVSTTAVREGRVRLFTSKAIRPDVLMASACLPHLFQAVEIEGEDYWDGGYLANPAIYPLLAREAPDDILLLPLNPFRRNDTPKDSGDIMDRLNEIMFNSPLVAELRALALVQDLLAQGRLTTTNPDYSGTRIHAVEVDDWLGDLSLSTKFNTEWSFLNDLKAKGREAADQWLTTCAAKLGKTSSVDLKARFL